jgi:hypothetical protein
MFGKLLTMGKRDYRHHEVKKAKKSAKSTTPPYQIVQTPLTVEIVKKKRKKAREEEL